MTSGSPATGSGDAALLHRLRHGDDAAFTELFDAHAPAVRRLARGLAINASEAEDVTAETFFRVLQAVKRGSGPKDTVRGYLLTVTRRVAYEYQGAARDIPVSDEELANRAGSYEYGVARLAEHNLISRAFASLPARWRTVLWHTEVEGERPAVVGRLFGLSANATAALARRARRGLRAAYLQAHLAAECQAEHAAMGRRRCGPVLTKLGGYTAGDVTGAEARKIKAHLRECADCAARHRELRDVSFSLREHAGALAAAGLTAGGAAAAGEVPSGAAAVTASSTANSAGAGTLGSAGLSGLQASMASAFGSLAGTLKGLASGAKLKVAAAVASTAAAGVFGFAATAQLAGEGSELISLPGYQGTPELTAARTTDNLDRSGEGGVPSPEELNNDRASWGIAQPDGEDGAGGDGESGEGGAVDAVDEVLDTTVSDDVTEDLTEDVVRETEGAGGDGARDGRGQGGGSARDGQDTAGPRCESGRYVDEHQVEHYYYYCEYEYYSYGQSYQYETYEYSYGATRGHR
ncbi:sigma-70 family RNA polymerase sigma factor [Haloechinothrix sp. LS1_15]|uniref:sigma-70 family RNA polymerase sigma factor n=1 Tax=Haloechinothrix sp. LS1_15 TaxID=2652248 RepID=UPI002946B6A5|nr:sigma-70 family RNA polymerase sigma factor [Haloechinothrix sp. LS1_15]MDV6014544.1 sigma-70 family RNA polymerase sigma factor [Haloechinothrix sp. LS1_15]